MSVVVEGANWGGQEITGCAERSIDPLPPSPQIEPRKRKGRKGELACVSRFLTYVMASSRMGDHGRTHKGQANEICARGVRIFCRCMRPPKS